MFADATQTIPQCSALSSQNAKRMPSSGITKTSISAVPVSQTYLSQNLANAALLKHARLREMMATLKQLLNVFWLFKGRKRKVYFFTLTNNFLNDSSVNVANKCFHRKYCEWRTLHFGSKKFLRFFIFSKIWSRPKYENPRDLNIYIPWVKSWYELSCCFCHPGY